MGNPVLRELARDVSVEEIRSPSMQSLLVDMLETLHSVGGIGLAAPQVSESIKLAIIEFGEENPRYPGMGKQPLLVLFNPKITILDANPQEFWEGCLSVPGLRGLVARPRKIRVDYLDENAQAQSIEAEDFLATVFQHELDHLAGILYVDKLVSTQHFSYVDELGSVETLD